MVPDFILAMKQYQPHPFMKRTVFGEDKSARLEETLAVPTAGTPKELLSM